MRDFLARLNITGFDASSYINNHARNVSALPNIAIAASGGGYRAMLNGAGAIKAFDSREESSNTTGHLGGLLQSATYLAGLSGGGWLVSSIMLNNFTTIGSLQRGSNASSVWQLGNSIFQGPNKGSIQVLDTADYFATIVNEVAAKKEAGFQTSITDYWGRALSFQIINATDGGDDYTWSSIQLQDGFSTGQTPMPILIADSRLPGQSIIPSNTTIFEFNPFEFGTWDPTIFGFVPMEFVGSELYAGRLQGQKCVRGFDNAGFVFGTSSSLFNQLLLHLNDSEDIPTLAKQFISTILKEFSDDNNDISDWTPSPFFNYANDTNPYAHDQFLSLVDGGEDNQNIPLHPLTQPTRHVDVIFAIDSSADTNGYPNGSSLVATYERSLNVSSGSAKGISNGTSFPFVPDVNTFINLGLNNRPSFFGCNASNTTAPTPLIVYLPSAPYIFQPNTSTFKMSYDTWTRDALIANGYAVATMGNGTQDTEWPTCVGCAVLSRSLGRTGTMVPDACTKCLNKYCWDGTRNSTTPAPYEPQLKQPNLKMKTSGATGLNRSSEEGRALLFTVFLVLFMDLLST